MKGIPKSRVQFEWTREHVDELYRGNLGLELDRRRDWRSLCSEGLLKGCEMCPVHQLTRGSPDLPFQGSFGVPPPGTEDGLGMGLSAQPWPGARGVAGTGHLTFPYL